MPTRCKPLRALLNEFLKNQIIAQKKHFRRDSIPHLAGSRKKCALS